MNLRHDRPTLQPFTSAGPMAYDDYPAIKPPGWKWSIVLYFFFGGVASGSYVAATLVDLFGSPEDRSVGRVGRYLAFLTVLACPVLLVLDLGRPERFANMLRILKVRSPMSMGSWGLTTFSALAGLAAVRQAVDDGLVPRDSLVARALAWVPPSASGLLGTAAGFFVGSYTGVLVSFTNVPVWARDHVLQGPLFLTSALSTGLSAISLALAATRGAPRRAHDWLRRTAVAASLVELLITVGSLLTLRSFSRPMTSGRTGVVYWLGALAVGIVLPLVLRLGAPAASADSRDARSAEALASLATLLGGLALRAATVFAGKPSAENPHEYLRYTHAQPRR